MNLIRYEGRVAEGVAYILYIPFGEAADAVDRRSAIVAAAHARHISAEDTAARLVQQMESHGMSTGQGKPLSVYADHTAEHLAAEIDVSLVQAGEVVHRRAAEVKKAWAAQVPASKLASRIATNLSARAAHAGLSVGFEFDPRAIESRRVREAVLRAKVKTARKKALAASPPSPPKKKGAASGCKCKAKCKAKCACKRRTQTGKAIGKARTVSIPVRATPKAKKATIVRVPQAEARDFFVHLPPSAWTPATRQVAAKYGFSGGQKLSGAQKDALRAYHSAILAESRHSADDEYNAAAKRRHQAATDRAYRACKKAGVPESILTDVGEAGHAGLAFGAIQFAEVRTLSPEGPTMARVSYVDDVTGRNKTVEGLRGNMHMRAMLDEAARQGVRVKHVVKAHR